MAAASSSSTYHSSYWDPSKLVSPEAIRDAVFHHPEEISREGLRTYSLTLHKMMCYRELPVPLLESVTYLYESALFFLNSLDTPQVAAIPKHSFRFNALHIKLAEWLADGYELIDEKKLQSGLHSTVIKVSVVKGAEKVASLAKKIFVATEGLPMNQQRFSARNELAFSLILPSGCHVAFSGKESKDRSQIVLLSPLAQYDMVDYLNFKSPSLKQVRTYLFQVLQTLVRAHATPFTRKDGSDSQGIIITDLKLENIFILPDGSAQIGDHGETSLYGQKRFGGTPVIDAPECHTSDSYGTTANTMWQFGVCLFSSLCSKSPIREDFASWEDPDKVSEEIQTNYAHAMTKTCLAHREHGKEGILLANKLLQYDPSKRPTAEEALADPFFADLCIEKSGIETLSPVAIQAVAPTLEEKRIPSETALAEALLALAKSNT